MGKPARIVPDNSFALQNRSAFHQVSPALRSGHIPIIPGGQNPPCSVCCAHAIFFSFCKGGHCPSQLPLGLLSLLY